MFISPYLSADKLSRPGLWPYDSFVLSSTSAFKVLTIPQCPKTHSLPKSTHTRNTLWESIRLLWNNLWCIDSRENASAGLSFCTGSLWYPSHGLYPLSPSSSTWLLMSSCPPSVSFFIFFFHTYMRHFHTSEFSCRCNDCTPPGVREPGKPTSTTRVCTTGEERVPAAQCKVWQCIWRLLGEKVWAQLPHIHIIKYH